MGVKLKKRARKRVVVRAGRMGFHAKVLKGVVDDVEG